MVGQALQMPGHIEQEHDGVDVLLIAAQDGLELIQQLCVESVDLAVRHKHLARGDRVLAHERVKRSLQDRTRAVGEHGHRRGSRHRVLVEQVKRPLGDVLGQVADALELAVDLDDGGHEPQVAGHRLVEREDLEALLLDLDLVLVDQHVGGDHLASLGGIALLDGLEGEAETLLHQRAERQDLPLQPVRLSLQMAHARPCLSRSGR